MSQISEAKINNVLGLLNTWVSGYISPSAQMAIKDGINLIEALREENEILREELDKYKKRDNVEAVDIEF